VIGVAVRDRADVPELDAIEVALGYRFVDRELLRRALTHRSHAYERGDDASGSYERLEFLGDALLGFLVADWLFRTDVAASEGRLSRCRQAVVRTSSLANTARALGLGDAILLGKGEARTGGRDKHSLLADTFEAVLGAVYLDGGIRPARAFVRRHLRAALERTGAAMHPADDFKTRLQEAVQARLQRTPTYRIVSTSGPAHELRFEVEVLVDGRALARGTGTNRKRAEQDAARLALLAVDSSDP
jgi:ribonuclease-3